MQSDAGTLPESDGPPEQDAKQLMEALALVVVWCAEEPQRLGEVLLPPPGRPGAQSVVGRDTGSPDDLHPRLPLVRQRPGVCEPTPPLAIQQISRVQLFVRCIDEDVLEVKRAGRCLVRHNGHPVETATLREGDALQLGNQMVLLAVRRPPRLPEISAPETPFGEADPFGLVGESPALWQLRERIAFLAPRSGHVLITGASGTGKELVARALHAASPRASRPLVARNAATFPEGLIDAELFGNARNYPNAGMAERPGLIGEADGGTFYLDEVAELPPAMQAHLLRVLDAGEYQRLGESQTRRSSFRFIGASNRPVSTLKDDLAARLILRVEVPPLNARREDVPLLVRHLLQSIARRDPRVPARFSGNGEGKGEPRLSAAAMTSLVQRHYTAHVRELEALLWEALASSRGDTLELVNPGQASAAIAVPTAAPARARRATDSVDPAGLTAEQIQRCLDDHQGAIQPTWRALSLGSRHVLARLIAKHRLRAGREWKAS